MLHSFHSQDCLHEFLPTYRREDLIPYDKSTIKILKEKKKSRPFCRFEKRNNKPLSNQIVLEEKVVEEDVTSEASSDISSIASLQSISGDCSVPMMNNGLVQHFYLLIGNLKSCYADSAFDMSEKYLTHGSYFD